MPSEDLEWHGHNDFYKAVTNAATAWLYGCGAVNCTLFGIGERTGNVDIITLAMNMYSHGVDPKLDFSNMPEIVDEFEKVTRMRVHDRQPYAGSLVFAAFSGSHQDAIAKSMKWRETHKMHDWVVPYIPVDPHDVGREYETDVIRINSQSGKGGIGYVLETRFGYNLPKRMREHVGYLVKSISDHEHRELSPDEVYLIFREHYIDITKPLNLTDVHYVQHNGIEATIDIEYNGETASATNNGNGRLDAVSNAVRSYTGITYTLNSYTEHALEVGSTSKAVSYVELLNSEKESFWGVGIDNDIMTSSVKAFVSALNNMLTQQKA